MGYECRLSVTARRPAPSCIDESRKLYLQSQQLAWKTGLPDSGDRLRISDDTTYVLIDESGQFGDTKPILVGACVVSDLSRLERKVGELYELYRESPVLEGNATFEAFVRQGFHYSGDPWEIQTIFIDHLSRLHGYRAHVAYSFGRQEDEGSTSAVQKRLYRQLLPDVILSSRAQKLHILFETNDSLNSAFGQLVEDAVVSAQMKSRHPLPKVEHEILMKQDLWSLSIIDYCLAVVGNWIGADMSTDPSRREAKNFRAVQGNLAVILNSDSGQRYTRRAREFR